jgi:hypothetical protein
LAEGKGSLFEEAGGDASANGPEATLGDEGWGVVIQGSASGHGSFQFSGEFLPMAAGGVMDDTVGSVLDAMTGSGSATSPFAIATRHEGGVEGSDSVEDGTLDQKVGGDTEVVTADIGFLGKGKEHFIALNRSGVEWIGGEHLDAAGHDTGLGLLHGLESGGEPVGGGEAIGVGEGEDVAAGGRQGVVTGGIGSAGGPAKNLETGFVWPDILEGRVGTVVDDEEIADDLCVGWLQEAFHTKLQTVQVILDGDDDGDGRHGGGHEGGGWMGRELDT